MYQQAQCDIEQLVQTITTNNRKISQNVNSMQQMIMRLESAASSDNESLRQQLSNTQTYTNQLVKDTNKLLQELSACSGSAGGGAAASRYRIIKERLASDFADALKEFQSAQLKEADRERAEMKRVRAASHGPNGHAGRANSALIDIDGGGGGGTGSSQAAGLLPPPPGGRQSSQPQHQPAGGVSAGYQQQQALMLEEESNLGMLREREEAVRNLERDIQGVNVIFKELATMAHSQAALVDSIEANVDSAAIRVQDGAEQLGQARRHQERARRKQICLAVTAILILTIIVTIIIVSAKS